MIYVTSIKSTRVMGRTKIFRKNLPLPSTRAQNHGASIYREQKDFKQCKECSPETELLRHASTSPRVRVEEATSACKRGQLLCPCFAQRAHSCNGVSMDRHRTTVRSSRTTWVDPLTLDPFQSTLVQANYRFGRKNVTHSLRSWRPSPFSRPTNSGGPSKT